MKITEVQEILHAQLVTDLVEDFDVEFGYGCDLMSDVLAFVQHNDILLTGLVNPQVIRTCEVVDIHAIVFVRGKVPAQELIDIAMSAGITLLCTEYSLYTSCGLLYQHGLFGEEIGHDFSL